MKKAERYKAVIDYFITHTPFAETELHYNNPFELLVAVILSAQCTDKRVNMVTPALFQAFPNPQKMADSDVDTIFSYIRSISYPNNKAKHLLGMAQMLLILQFFVKLTMGHLLHVVGIINRVLKMQLNMA